MASGLTSRRGLASADGSAQALYLYGVSERSETAAGEGLTGVDGTAAVESIPCGEFFCWVSRVPRAEYATRLTENMENLDWLAAAGVRHQRAVGRLAERLDVLPARFGSVFLSEASLAADVRTRAGALREALQRIRGAEEWGVKLFAQSEPAAPTAASSGREYLQHKSVAIANRARPGAPPEVEALARELDTIARASTLHPRPAATQPGLVWQASYLVPRDRVKRFHALLQRWAKRLASARIETTGPWPSYSFVDSSAGKRRPPGRTAEANRPPAASASKPRKQRTATRTRTARGKAKRRR